ncbi:hypothetical protein ACP70R_033299 [Stipagrostis hirtigluma subsp. patula]
MAAHVHRNLLAASTHYVLHWRCNIGIGHTPPPSAGDHAPPPAAPRPPELDNVSARGREDILGDGKWSRAEVLRYAGLARAAYDAFDHNTGASSCVGRRLLSAPGHGDGGVYVATVPLYSTVDIVPGVDFDDRRRWIGYVAVAAERDHAGYRDIVVVWRGTAVWDEMLKDLEALLLVAVHGGDGEERVPGTTLPPARARGVPEVLDDIRRLVTTSFSLGGALAMLNAWDAAKVHVAKWFHICDGSIEHCKHTARRQVHDELRRVVTPLSHGGAPAMRTAWGAGKVHVANGFHSLYTSSCGTCEKNGTPVPSAQSQVLDELRRLVAHFRDKHPDEKIRVTATGHSLGGALAVLTARDAADELSSAGGGAAGCRVPVRAVTFGGPRVGNRAFRDELLASRGVRVLRVSIKQDMVPRVPPALIGYVHAGDELELDAGSHLDVTNLLGLFHRLDLYLHLLGGGEISPDAGMFRWDKGDCGCEMPAPEPDKNDLPLELSKLDEMIYSSKSPMT